MGRATQRAIEILELIAEAEGEWSHAAIARRLSIPKSTLTDLLRDLVQRQYLELGDGGFYLIGPRVLTLSRSYLRRMDVVSRAKDILLRLAEKADEAVSIAIARGVEIVIVAQELPAKPLVAAMTLGDHGPMIATATGKAILAHMDEVSVAKIVEETRRQNLKLLKPKSQRALFAELAAIRAGGLAYNLQEWVDGLSAVALPVFSFEGPIASLAIAAPASRITPKWLDTMEPELRRAAEELTGRMGGVTARALNGAKAATRRRGTAGKRG